MNIWTRLAHFVTNHFPFLFFHTTQEVAVVDNSWDEPTLDEALEELDLDQTCARCGHKRSDHRYDFLECTKCGYPAKCSQFLEESEYTSELRLDWKDKKSQEWMDDWYLDHDDYEDEEDYSSEFFDERSCQWGESISLYFHHPVFGYTSLSMLEGEWLQSFKDMRRLKMMPDEQIDKLEELFEQARRDHR